MTKQEREHRKRQKEKMKMTLAHEKRSNRPKTPGFGESKHELTFSVGRGFKWKVNNRLFHVNDLLFFVEAYIVIKSKGMLL